MAPQSTSGILPLSHSILSFDYRFLSSLHNSLLSGSWIIDSGGTMHASSDLAMFSQVSYVTGVTVSLPNGIKEHISNIGIL
ncbi:hypothetical protein Bca101_059801 [Brassica carinata]